MSVNFPLGLSLFWQKLRFAGRAGFDLNNYKLTGMDAAGNTLNAKLGQAKWVASVKLAGGWHDANIDMEVLLKTLMMRDGTFYAFDSRRPYPKLDPHGLIIGAATPSINTKGANNRSLSLKGLPATYKLSPGDWISVAYSTASIQLLQVCETVTAAAGVTPEFEVVPYLSTGLGVNNPVTIKKAAGLFKIAADGYRVGDAVGNIISGSAFSIYGVPNP
jgi:hypothetical protein